MRPIAYIRTDLTEKFGVPRQSGLAEGLKGRIVFEPEYRVREAFRGLDGFSYIWVIWEFSESKRPIHDSDAPAASGDKDAPAASGDTDTANDGHMKWSPTVRPPALGGNKRMGVFATRSPFRPNNIGLSSVRLERIDHDDPEGPVLIVSGVDMMDNTPVFDIKPYIKYADSHPDASDGFLEQAIRPDLEIVFPEDLLAKVPDEKRTALFEILSLDPAPAYQKEPGRVYGMKYAGLEIRFCIEGNNLTVIEVE